MYYTSSLDYKDGEELVDFYLKTKKMEQEINIQQDQTGQLQRLN